MKWFLIALLILVLSWILQSGLVAFAMYVVLGMALLTRLLVREQFSQVTAVRLGTGGTFEIGQEVRVRVVVVSQSRFPIPWVILEDLLPIDALSEKPPRLRVSKGQRAKVVVLWGQQERVLSYRLALERRGYYQIGPLVMESGDLFGLHRRHRLLTDPIFALVYPKIVALSGYDIASRRPIGDIRLTHRLYEDPTRLAGVRPYMPGDPLQRIHWKATARTGALHCKLYDATTMAGATVLLDLHQAGYPSRGEPLRSDLAVTVAASLAHAVAWLGQPIGLGTNGRDAVERIQTALAARPLRHGPDAGRLFDSANAAREAAEVRPQNDHWQPLWVPTQRGVEQFPRIREVLARVELTDGLSMMDLVAELLPRLPRDASIIAVLPAVTVESAVTLGLLRRQGLAVSVVLVLLEAAALEQAVGQLANEGIYDVRHVRNETDLATLCDRSIQPRTATYSLLD